MLRVGTFRWRAKMRVQVFPRSYVEAEDGLAFLVLEVRIHTKMRVQVCLGRESKPLLGLLALTGVCHSRICAFRTVLMALCYMVLVLLFSSAGVLVMGLEDYRDWVQIAVARSCYGIGLWGGIWHVYVSAYVFRAQGIFLGGVVLGDQVTGLLQ